MEDYIDGDKFQSLACEDIIYYDVFEEKFHDIGHSYKMVTHNSDFSPKQVELPEYISAWYSQNLDFKQDRVHCIPIGLERARWHPGKMEIMCRTNIFVPRKLRALAYFNPRTNLDERLPLARLCDSGAIPGDFKWTLNGTGFKEYIELLQTYKFCLCPAGNGIDTHRIWEALYLGCIPIVKKCITYEYLEGLPVMFLNDWAELSYKKLEDFVSSTDHFGYNNIESGKLEKMKFSYWASKIKMGLKP